MTYQRNHLIPFLDLFNHKLIKESPQDTFFTELSTWTMTEHDQLFRLQSTVSHVQGAEVFISYGSRGVNEVLVHYGFLQDIPESFYQPSIRVWPRESDPLFLPKLEAIITCWPSEAAEEAIIMARYLPVELFQRAQIIVERRPEMILNATAAKRFCKTSDVFTDRRIESLRRNKRAMLFIYEAMLRRMAKTVPRSENERLLAANPSYNMRNLIEYRQKMRNNLDRAIRSFEQGTWRLLKQIHVQADAGFADGT